MYEKKHALPNKKIHTPKGIARLTVTAATMAAMTGSPNDSDAGRHFFSHTAARQPPPSDTF